MMVGGGQWRKAVNGQAGGKGNSICKCLDSLGWMLQKKENTIEMELLLDETSFFEK
jgi:hypothetical protein